MKPYDIVPINSLGPDNKKRITYLLNEIRNKAEMTSNKVISIDLDPFAENNWQKLDDLKYLERFGIIKHPGTPTDEKGHAINFTMAVDKDKLFKTIFTLEAGFDAHLEQQQKRKNESMILYYDLQKHQFDYGRNSTTLKASSIEEKVCELLITDKLSERIWNHDEVLIGLAFFDEYDSDQIKQRDMTKIYTAANGINKKVNILTNGIIDKIFIAGKYTIKINPEYKTRIATR